MNRLPFFLTLLFLYPFLLSGQEEFEFIPDLKPSPTYPFSFTADYIDVHKAHFRTPGLEGEHLKYQQIDAAFAYTHPLCEEFGLIFGAGYVGTIVDWKENPDFRETRFNYVTFSAGTYSKQVEDWFWSFNANIFLDTAEQSFSDYALYQAVLWGRYHWFSCLTLHGGFILEAGLHKEKVWPIFGFDYAPYPDDWKLSVIYPIEIYFDYFITKTLSTGASIRFLRNRHRVLESEPLPRGIFEYRTTGLEFDLTFTPFRWILASGFFGSTFNGDLKVTNSNNHHAVHYKFKGSLYGGVSGRLSY